MKSIANEQGTTEHEHAEKILDEYGVLPKTEPKQENSKLPLLTDFGIISGILKFDRHFSVKKEQIAEFFNENDDTQERAEFMKSVFNSEYTEFDVDTHRVGYKTVDNGLNIWEGNYLTHTTENTLSWDLVQSITAQLIEHGEYLDKPQNPIVTNAEELAEGDRIRLDGEEWTVRFVGDNFISLNNAEGKEQNFYNALDQKWYEMLNFRGFEFISALNEKHSDLERAKELINEYCDREFEAQADFSNLANVPLAYTSDEETNLPIGVYADLENKRILSQFNNVTVRVDEYTSLSEMNDTALSSLNFDDLILDTITYRAPTITCEWSESEVFEKGKIYSVAEFDALMKRADDEHIAGKNAAIKHYGSEKAWIAADDSNYSRYLGYDKTKFIVNMPDGKRS